MGITINDKYIFSEAFQLKESVNIDTGKMGYYFNTKIVPYNVKSRNGVMYKKESIEKTKDMLVGKHLMYNHIIDSKDLPNGEWVSVESKDDGLYGRARVYNTEYNKPFIEFLQEASAPRVSLQIIGQAETFDDGVDGQYQVAYINDWLEASIVAVPGFDDAKGQSFEYALAEAYKKNITVNTLKEDINLSTANGALKPAGLPSKDDNKEELDMSKKKKMKGQEAVEDEEQKKSEMDDEFTKHEEVDSDEDKKEQAEDKDSKKEEIEDDKDSKKEEVEDEKSKKEIVEDDSKKEEVEDKYAGLEERIAKLEAMMDNDDAKKEAVEDDSKEVEEESKTEEVDDDEEKKEEVNEIPEDSEEEPAKPKTESINSILSFDIISENVSSKENDFKNTVKEILG